MKPSDDFSLPSPLPMHLSPSLTDEADVEVGEEGDEKITIGAKILNMIAIVVPFIGFIVAVVLSWGWGVGWLEMATLAFMYIITAGGVTVGFHRYFTHKSFSTYKPIEFLMGVAASMSLQGTLMGWVATHRCHHQFSDKPGDPHSPHVDHDHHNIGGGIKGIVVGYFHSHMGWLFQDDPKNLAKYIPDLIASRVCRVVSNLFVLWVALGVILPGVFVGLVTQSWWGFLMGFLWGGVARLFLVHHVTWSINSACHIWGARTYKSHDHSRNNVVFGVLALGEGWHNNHHAFPTSVRHGLEWWQFDASYIFIKGMEKLGLAWDLKIPPKARMDAKRVGNSVVGPMGQPITYTDPK